MNREESFDEKKIELHHESIEEILGMPPPVLVRAGSGTLFSVIALLIAGSVFFPSNTSIRVPAILDGGMPLSVAIAPATGNIRSHHSENYINEGDTVLFIENMHGESVVVCADVSGFLEVNPLMEMKRHIYESDTIAFIWPADQDTVACIMRLTSYQGKDVRVGSEVRIVIDDYPVEQYGAFESTIKYISHFNAEFHAYAELPIDMITTTHQHLNIRGDIPATVEIVTDEKTVFHRMVNPFRGLIKK